MFRTSRVAALLAAVAVVAAACTGGSSSPDSATGDDGTTGSESGSAAGGDITLRLARFFGDCDDTTQGVTDVNEATTECEAIQILTNDFNAMDNGITLEKLGGQAWDDYYTQLSTTFAGGNPPDVAVMHQHRLPDFAGRDLLLPLGDRLEPAGIDFTDYTEPAQDAATYQDEVFAVPFDIHASLWHMNVDLFEEAGLVDADGAPIVPTSVDELLEQAATLQEETGAQYFGQDWFEFGTAGRLFLGLVAQQGGSLLADDGSAQVNTPEGAEALSVLNTLVDEGYSDSSQGYTDAQQGFLNGDVAVLHNGTWVVDQYDRETSFDYRVEELPTLFGEPAAWGDSHMWVLPRGEEDPARIEASMAFTSYLYENIAAWARGTGHLAPRTSLLEGDALADAPQRANYAETAEIADLVPAVPGWAGAWDALAEELNATWLTDKDPQAALEAAEGRMNEELGG